MATEVQYLWQNEWHPVSDGAPAARAVRALLEAGGVSSPDTITFERPSGVRHKYRLVEVPEESPPANVVHFAITIEDDGADPEAVMRQAIAGGLPPEYLHEYCLLTSTVVEAL